MSLTAHYSPNSGPIIWREPLQDTAKVIVTAGAIAIFALAPPSIQPQLRSMLSPVAAMHRDRRLITQRLFAIARRQKRKGVIPMPN